MRFFCVWVGGVDKYQNLGNCQDYLYLLENARTHTKKEKKKRKLKIPFKMNSSTDPEEFKIAAIGNDHHVHKYFLFF